MADLSDVAETILEERYLAQDETGAVVETPDELFQRVAANLAAAEDEWGRDVDAFEDRFYRVMRDLQFLPSSPVLMNAGTDLQQLAACFVLPIEDSLDAIFETLKQTALIHQSGGGTGFSFSQIRPRGDVVQKTGGVASGPVSFMHVFDAATEQIKQGGRRRGANMGVLSVHHPDVFEFLTAKRETDDLRNFNLSVATTDEFWDAFEAGAEYDLVNPRTDEVVATADPERVVETVSEMAWATGDPGLLYLDRIQDANPTPEVGTIRSTNPCGETPLLPYEACILGSVNLGTMTDDGEIDWDTLSRTVRVGVRMLDDAIAQSTFPTAESADRMAANRKIGLGVMGFHDMLVDLGIPYDSQAALDCANEVMSFIDEEAFTASRLLAEVRGSFPNVDESVFDPPLRNATRTAIAPTGTVSMIAGCSAGIEPIYDVAYEKHVMGGVEVVNDRFLELARERGFYTDDLVERVRAADSLAAVEGVPNDVAELFVTAHEVSPMHELAMQAAFQDHVDNAVSKTINLPHDADQKRVRDVFLQARELGVKGVTVFRSGSKPEQILDDDPLKEECASECDYVAPEREE